MRLLYFLAFAVVLALVALLAAGLVWLRHSLETTLPIIPPPDLLGIFFDATPVTVVFTVGVDQVRWQTTADDIRGNLTLWRHMHLAEWNTVPEPFRHEGLDKMLARYPKQRVVAEDRPFDNNRCDRGDDGRAEQRRVHVADDFLERK
jgi:hypothetical protein